MKDKKITVSRSSGSDGSAILFALFVVFLVLKLTGTVGWSWWLVTMPLWIGPALVLVILLVATFLLGVYGIVLGALSVREESKRDKRVNASRVVKPSGSSR